MRPLTAVTAGNDRRGPTPRSAGSSAKPRQGSNWGPEALRRRTDGCVATAMSRYSASASPRWSSWPAWRSAARPVPLAVDRCRLRRGERSAGKRAALHGHSVTVRRADGPGWRRADGERSEPGVPGLHVLHRLPPGKPKEDVCLHARHEGQHRPPLGYGSSSNLAEIEPHQRGAAGGQRRDSRGVSVPERRYSREHGRGRHRQARPVLERAMDRRPPDPSPCRAAAGWRRVILSKILRTEGQADRPYVGVGPSGFYDDDTVLEVGPDGSVRREKSVIDILFRSGWESVLFSRPGAARRIREEDPIHINDVERLKPEDGGRIPDVRPRGPTAVTARDQHPAGGRSADLEGEMGDDWAIPRPARPGLPAERPYHGLSTIGSRARSRASAIPGCSRSTGRPPRTWSGSSRGTAGAAVLRGNRAASSSCCPTATS